MSSLFQASIATLSHNDQHEAGTAKRNISYLEKAFKGSAGQAKGYHFSTKSVVRYNCSKHPLQRNCIMTNMRQELQKGTFLIFKRQGSTGQAKAYCFPTKSIVRYNISLSNSITFTHCVSSQGYRNKHICLCACGHVLICT